MHVCVCVCVSIQVAVYQHFKSAFHIKKRRCFDIDRKHWGKQNIRAQCQSSSPVLTAHGHPHHKASARREETEHCIGPPQLRRVRIHGKGIRESKGIERAGMSSSRLIDGQARERDEEMAK